MILCIKPLDLYQNEPFMPENPFLQLFQKQQQHQYVVGNTSVKERIRKLNSLKKAIEVTYRSKIHEALKKDLNKSITETDLTEIYPVTSEIKFIKKHLWHWVKSKAHQHHYHFWRKFLHKI